MANLSFYDKQHIQKVLVQQNEVSAIFNRFIMSVSPYLQRWTDTGKSNVWVRNNSIENIIDRRLNNLYTELLNNIQTFQNEAWSRANLKTDDMIGQYIKGMSISSLKRQGMFGQNMDALKQTQKRIENGLDLSKRVWNVTQQTKSQLEFYLSSGISAGRAAAGISQDMRQILNNPDKRFRRIRNEKGELVLSQPMKDYHPGTGVYRSARMNALRVAASETNIAYRSADQERWMKLDFVTGIRVQRSGNNGGPCKICDAMAGDYPKTFRFTIWHPFCICFATPILLDSDEFANYLLTDQIPESRYVSSLPDNAQAFILDNQKIASSFLWVKDNFPGDKLTSLIENREFIKYTQPSLNDQIIETENRIRMNRFETGVLYDKNGNILLEKRGDSSSISFTQEECDRMSNAILTHNHPIGWKYPENSIERIGNSFSQADVYLAINNNLSEIRAVTPNYTFILKRPKKGWGLSIEEAVKVIQSERVELSEEFINRIRNNTLTELQSNTTFYHILWKRVSKKCNWEYSKAKTR